MSPEISVMSFASKSFQNSHIRKGYCALSRNHLSPFGRARTNQGTNMTATEEFNIAFDQYLHLIPHISKPFDLLAIPVIDYSRKCSDCCWNVASQLIHLFDRKR